MKGTRLVKGNGNTYGNSYGNPVRHSVRLRHSWGLGSYTTARTGFVRAPARMRPARSRSGSVHESAWIPMGMPTTAESAPKQPDATCAEREGFN
jgi:hypothetical protein